MKYQIIAAQTLRTLEDMVNNEMRHGWRVTGGLAAYPIKSKEYPAAPMFVQAMIHEGKEQ